jgi:hypothetical protein
MLLLFFWREVMGSLLEYVGYVHIYLGPYRGNPIALYLLRSDKGCRIGPKAYPWNDVIGIGETPNKAAADFEEKWKGKGLSADLYSGPSWEGGIKPEKPAPPKPAAPPKPSATPGTPAQPASTSTAPAGSGSAPSPPTKPSTNAPAQPASATPAPPGSPTPEATKAPVSATPSNTNAAPLAAGGNPSAPSPPAQAPVPATPLKTTAPQRDSKS